MSGQVDVERLMDVITDDLRDHDRRITALELNDVKQDQRIEHVLKSLDKIESNTTWIMRLIIGGLVTGAIGLLYTLASGG